LSSSELFEDELKNYIKHDKYIFIENLYIIYIIRPGIVGFTNLGV